MMEIIILLLIDDNRSRNMSGMSGLGGMSGMSGLGGLGGLNDGVLWCRCQGWLLKAGCQGWTVKGGCQVRRKMSQRWDR